MSVVRGKLPEKTCGRSFKGAGLKGEPVFIWGIPDSETMNTPPV